LGAVLLSLFLAALDQTIVATALPAIVRDFDGLSLVSWVSTGYLLASTAMVPIYGKLSDLYGRKPVLLWGIVVFLIGSALCGIAQSMMPADCLSGGAGVGAAANHVDRVRDACRSVRCSGPAAVYGVVSRRLLAWQVWLDRFWVVC
jgi:MFS family permease